MDHQNVVVAKPWGWEYLIYENSDIALWLLHIEGGQRTSMHCHPKKTTGLLLLSGEAELSFIADSKLLVAPAKEMLRRGLFHSTKALSPEGIYMLEVETPPDKLDLVRLVDSYGRSHEGYETEVAETPKTSDCIWIDDKLPYKEYEVDNTGFVVRSIDDLDYFNRAPKEQIVMFLRGGLCKVVDGKRHMATVPGDVGRVGVIRKVAKNVDYLQNDTLILIK